MTSGGDRYVSDSCHLCGARLLREADGFSALPRVTSDCKPFPAGGRIGACAVCGAVQKIVDERWQSDVDSIYRDFEIYHQSGGEEQAIFGEDGSAIPRSQKLIAALGHALSDRSEGRLLDFGCGNGAMLASFSSAWPGWDLYGSELSDKSVAALKSIPRFKQLFVCPIERIPTRFNLATLIHALEHLPEPTEMLRQIGALLEQDGRVFVQVPDANRNPYDLLVADHLMHFTVDTLGYLTRLAGYDTRTLSDRVLVKELSWVGSPAQEGMRARFDVPPTPILGAKLLARGLDWLAAQLQTARAISSDSRSFGVFGSSISATWLAGALGDQVSFFVDEDPSRVGRRHLGRPILDPAAVAETADVFIPLIPDIATSVGRKMSSKPGRYHEPPPLRAEGHADATS
jgi:2-polyprenyl-3-methyl-5-hydroxy-6-metoxy-1,4-benzoquinol methylase